LFIIPIILSKSIIPIKINELNNIKLKPKYGMANDINNAG
jgi:hypothetical protein